MAQNATRKAGKVQQVTLAQVEIHDTRTLRKADKHALHDTHKAAIGKRWAWASFTSAHDGSDASVVAATTFMMRREVYPAYFTPLHLYITPVQVMCMGEREPKPAPEGDTGKGKTKAPRAQATITTPEPEPKAVKPARTRKASPPAPAPKARVSGKLADDIKTLGLRPSPQGRDAGLIDAAARRRESANAAREAHDSTPRPVQRETFAETRARIRDEAEGADNALVARVSEVSTLNRLNALETMLQRERARAVRLGYVEI